MVCDGNREKITEYRDIRVDKRVGGGGIYILWACEREFRVPFFTTSHGIALR